MAVSIFYLTLLYSVRRNERIFLGFAAHCFLFIVPTLSLFFFFFVKFSMIFLIVNTMSILLLLLKNLSK